MSTELFQDNQVQDVEPLDCSRCPSGTCHESCPNYTHQPIDNRCAHSDVQCVECDHVTTCPIVKRLTNIQIDQWARINSVYRQLVG